MVAAPPSPVRAAVLAPVAVVLLLAAACTTGSAPAPQASPSPSSSSPAPPTTAPDAGSASPTGSAPTTAAPGSTDPAAGPEFLCQSAEQPRDTADAYTGALSSGSLEQAVACVYPGTVPEATTRGLLVTGAQGSAYTLDEAATAGDVFAYDGPQGRVDVTVTVQADGHDWVTGVRRE